jgi:hypothetical protein
MFAKDLTWKDIAKIAVFVNACFLPVFASIAVVVVMN